MTSTERHSRTTTTRRTILFLVLAVTVAAEAVAPSETLAGKTYRWHSDSPVLSLSDRFPPPPGYTRVRTSQGSFGAWLRGLPLKEGRGEVRLCTGELKADQTVHCAVVDIDTGSRDLQQCADAVIRLRAEYLFSKRCEGDIEYRFTSGDLARWLDYRDGVRPKIRGNRVSWILQAAPDSSYASFRRYLDLVFSYAGTASLGRELLPVPDPGEIAPGDVFNQPNGHAVLVMDVATDNAGRRVFLLAQSYMPAQDIHVLNNPENPASPWYTVKTARPLVTPEWTFGYAQLRRFPLTPCDN